MGCSSTTILETGASKSITAVVQSKKNVSQFYLSATPLLAPSWSFFLFLLLLLLSILLILLPLLLLLLFLLFLVSLQIRFLGGAFHASDRFSFRLSKVSFCRIFCHADCMHEYEYFLMPLHHCGWSSTGFVWF